MRDVKASRGSVGDTVTRINAGQCRFRMPVGERDFSYLQNHQNDSEAHSTSYSKYNGVLSRGSGGQGVRLTNQLHLMCTEVSSDWKYKAGDTLSSRHVMLRVQLGYLTLNSGAPSHFCHSAYVTWSDVELWEAHVTARLSNFCCRTHFVRHDVRVECSSTLWPVISRNGENAYWKSAPTDLFMTPSHQIIVISIWEPMHGKK
jgi:hypothetical protein